jgi:hypothetical protein
MVGSEVSSRPYKCSAVGGVYAVVGEPGEPGAGSGNEVKESVSSCDTSRCRRLDALLRVCSMVCW